MTVVKVKDGSSVVKIKTEGVAGPRGPEGSVSKEELASKADLEAGKLKESQMPDTAVSGSFPGQNSKSVPWEIPLSAYGAKGDNVTDDTAAIQKALDEAPAGSVVTGRPGASYKFSNLIFPNTERLTLDGRGARFISIGTGDVNYLIAPYNWVNNVATPGAEEQVIRRCRVLGSPTATLEGAKVNGIVGMNKRLTIEACDVSRCGTGILLTSQTKNGTNLTEPTVENRIMGNRLRECSSYNFRIFDPEAFRVTDGFFENNLCFNAGISNALFDKSSGWLIKGNHTYQLGSGLGGTLFTPGVNWDFDITECGVAWRFIENYVESGCVRIKAFSKTWNGKIDGNHFGLTCPNGATVRLESRQAEGSGEAALIALSNNIFYGPTTGNNYCFLTLVGPPAGAPMRVYINGGHFGFRTPISFSGQVKVFNKGVSIYQSAHNMPTDLIVDGYMPTSGARPPGVMYRTKAPEGSEACVVGDRWENPEPKAGEVPGGTCVAAGEPGTWVNRQPTSGDLAAPYRRVAIGWTRLDAQAKATLALAENSTGSFGAGSSGKAVFYFDPADQAITGRKTKLKLRVEVLTNGTAPTSTFTATLVPMSGNPSGGAAAVSVAAGAALATASIVAPAKETPTAADSGDFDAPAAGWYAISLAIATNNMVAESSSVVRVELLSHNV